MIRKYSVSLEGLTPILMHWDNIEWSDQMDQWKNDPANKKGSKAGDDRSPAFRWIGSVYHDGNEICISSDNLARCLMEGGAMVPVPGGKGNKTFKAQTQSGMKIDEMFVPLQVSGKAIPWKPFAELINEPSFPAHLQMDDQITEDVLKSLFEYAGTYKGLCDWRPGGKTPGPYGMFRLSAMNAV